MASSRLPWSSGAFLFCFLIAAGANSLFVKNIIDGDTFELSNGERVRLIGIDASEIAPSSKLTYDARARNVSEQTIKAEGRIAKNFAKKIALRKKVRLEFDREKRDRYGRLLAYVFVDDTLMINQVMLREGMALVYRNYPFIHKDAFLALEQDARTNDRGFWKEWPDSLRLH